MTALKKYQRLEAPGLWRPDPDEARRDVVVALGEATLTLTDSRSGQVLSHWSLPAIERLNPGESPALFAPGSDQLTETLELDDDLLIEALTTIRGALTPRRRLRLIGRVIVATLSFGLLVAAMTTLPGALVRHAAGIAPPAARAQIGRVILEDLTRPGSGVRLCGWPAGRQALTTLRSRVLGAGFRVNVVDGLPGFQVAAVPGRLILISRALLERLDSPEALAGYLLAQEIRVLAYDPLLPVLAHAGTRATIALLTTGTLPPEALAGYGAQALPGPLVLPEADILADRFATLPLWPVPFALSLPADLAATAEQLADMPRDPAMGLGRLLSDGEWLTLQGICQG